MNKKQAYAYKRQRMHALIDELPDDALDKARHFLELPKLKRYEALKD
jgi:hypothetical protein